MKRTLPFLLLLILGMHTPYAQDPLSETDKWAATARVWGFLKYFHPEVAAGKFDWDQELINILPQIKSAKSKEELSGVFETWIEGLGPVARCKRCDNDQKGNYFERNMDLGWLQNSAYFTPELAERLQYIAQNRHQGKKHYIAYFSGRPKIAYFRNEREFPDFQWQDESLRLLTLFRYWNMVEYFFPAKYQMDTPWGEVLEKMIPKFYRPESEEAYYLALMELVASLDDSHAVIYNKPDVCIMGCYHVPIVFKILDGQAVITGFYDRSLAQSDDLRVGDVITSINGKPTQQVFEEKKKYLYGSNSFRKALSAGYYLLGGDTDRVEVEGLRNGETFVKTLKRYPFKVFNNTGNPKREKYTFLGDSIGYINLSAVDAEEVTEVMETFKNTKALIFDLRKRNVRTPWQFTNYITSKKTRFYKAIYPDLDYPGRFIWSENRYVGNNQLLYTGRVIVLVDETCQSQMEFAAMCLQAGDNVTTIGRQTSGANGNVMRLKLVGGWQTQISGIGIFYPDGQEAQRKGVKVDIEVLQSIKAIAEGRDEILERAIQFINE